MDYTPPSLVRIPPSSDTMLQKSYLREFAISRYPEVELIRLDRDNTYVDPLYLETSSKMFKAPVTIRCLPQHEPNKKMLGKYGLEQERNVLFQVPTLLLEDIGYIYNDDSWIIGDLIRWGGDVYEVKDMVRATDGYWANSNIPFYFILGADYYRQGI